MAKELPLPERILNAAELMLRKHGAEKTNVVDIARSLDMSHGNIYRHYPSKKAILDAVAARWLRNVILPLEAIAADKNKPAAKRLSQWFETLRKIKRKKILDDPELFRVYHDIAVQASDTVDQHLDDLLNHVETIIADGIKSGEFASQASTRASARAFLQAMVAFHHPAMLLSDRPATDAEAKVVFDLMLAGLRARFA